MKPILCLDFDGVIHSYTSRWQGAAVVPDPPVPGALEFIVKALETYEVAIFSSRSHQWGGKRAMKHWLRSEYEALGQLEVCVQPWWGDCVNVLGASTMEPWYVSNRDAAAAIVKQIKWPWFKPPAKVTIDDRAITFTGVWPELAVLDKFKPWNK
jgi:hypothetical protein